jgi:hypothetical protein
LIKIKQVIKYLVFHSSSVPSHVRSYSDRESGHSRRICYEVALVRRAR